MRTTSTATAEEAEGAGRLALPEAPARQAPEAIEGRKGAVVAEGTVRPVLPVRKVLPALTVRPVRKVLAALTVRPVRKVLPALTVRPVGGEGADLRGLRVVVVNHPAWTWAVTRP